MSTALSGAIIGAALMIVFSLGFGSVYNAYSRWSSAFHSSRQAVGEQVRTAVQVTSIQAAPGTLTVAVKNTGQADHWQFDRMAVLLQINGGAGGARSEWVAYAAAGSTPGTWLTGGLAPDTFQPGIWDGGETLTLTVYLPALGENETVQSVLVVTPNGVKALGYL